MKVSLSTIPTKELATLAQRVINSSRKGEYRVIENHQLLIEIEKQYDLYQKIYTKKTYSGKGKIVANADRERSKIFTKMKKFLNGYREIDTMPNAKDAEDLYSVFKHFGLDLNRYNYARETAQLNKLIAALEQEENSQKLLALNLMDTFIELKEAQRSFEQLYSEQAEANADLHNLPTATRLRKDLEISLRDYFNLLTAMRKIDEWQLIYADINEIVKGIANSRHKNEEWQRN